MNPGFVDRMVDSKSSFLLGSRPGAVLPVLCDRIPLCGALKGLCTDVPYQAFDENWLSVALKIGEFSEVAEFLIVAIHAGIPFFSLSIRNVDQVREHSPHGSVASVLRNPEETRVTLVGRQSKANDGGTGG